MVRNVNIYSFADVLGLSNSQFTLIKLPFRILYHISVSAHEKVGRCADCSWCMKSVIIGACELALLFIYLFLGPVVIIPVVVSQTVCFTVC